MKTIAILASLLILATTAAAYELWLDIDLDGDPTTINNITWETSCTVNLVLAPTGTSEDIWTIEFGLGGSCRECDDVFQYGTGFDLGNLMTGTWETHPYFVGTCNGATCLNCLDDPGFHTAFFAEPLIDTSFYIEEPIVFATFQAWQADTPAGCSVLSNLAVMNGQGLEGVLNYIQIGGPALEAESSCWGALKTLYR